MNEFNIKVDIKNNKLIAPAIELVQNDYNSTKFVFDFIADNDYIKIFQLQLPDGSIWVKGIVNNQVVLADEKDGQIVPILVQNGKYTFDVAIYSNNAKLTTTNQESFFVRPELAGQEIELDDRLPILDGLIHSVNEAIKETDNLDIDIENSIVTVVKKDGTVKSENVKGDSYEITEDDYNTIETNVKSDIQPIIENIENVARQAEVIAKGASGTLNYLDYQDMVTNFNAFDKNKFDVSKNIMIKKLNVPDAWIYGFSEEYVEYTYTTDEDLISLLLSNEGLQIGYYVLSALETQKVDLTEYTKKEQFVTLTQEEYDALEVKNANTYYFIIEEE